jgi:hypothetical protein
MMATSGFQRSWVQMNSIIPRALRKCATHDIGMAVVDLLQKSTCLSDAFSDQIKAQKAPKMKNDYRFYGK